ncbi:MAG: glycosyltransferase family 2 protein [Candidatus Eremiobacteraeota bacterium]|nr:glycosyltransferase family 2 protein [Candidatus Eremiobacteraeota bacterium]
MPPIAAALIAGIPAAIVTALYVLRMHGARFEIDSVYYPTFAFVYAVWILPILGFMLFSLRPIRPNAHAAPKHRFICMVPAYNEERVIGNPIRSLLAQKYPKELFEVWVIFDGTDATAEIAERLGAKVLVTPTNGYGKHRALDYAFRKLLHPGDDRYVAVFDADNTVSDNFLQAMNDAIEARGFRCMQSFHDVLNGADNWITKALWCSCVSSSRMYLTGRMRSLSNVLICGTGWCCEAELLRKHWSHIKTQTEDIELNGILALESGVHVGYVPEAHIYDEKPLNIWVSIRQRMRWMCGHARVAYYYFFRCVWEGMRRGDLALIELASYYLVPFALLISFLTWPLLAGISLGVFRIAGPLASGPVEHLFEAIAVFFIFGYQIVGFWNTKELGGGGFTRACRVVLYSLYTCIFAILVWPPALVWALFSVAKSDWLYHTPHVSDATEEALLAQRTAAVRVNAATALAPQAATN